VTVFISLLSVADKADALSAAVSRVSECWTELDHRIFQSIPNSPFAYWASRELLSVRPGGLRVARIG